MTQLSLAETSSLKPVLPDHLTADDVLTMELYYQREGNLTPEQSGQLLAWVKAFRQHVEDSDRRRTGPLRGEF